MYTLVLYLVTVQLCMSQMCQCLLPTLKSGCMLPLLPENILSNPIWCFVMDETYIPGSECHCNLFHLSAILWHLTYPVQWATLGTHVSLGKLFHCSQHTIPKNIKHAQTQPSQGTNSHLVRVEPRRFISCTLRNSH